MMGDYLSDSEWHFSKVVEEKHVFVEAPRLIKPKKNISNNNNNSYNNPRSRSKYNNNNNQNYPNERSYDQDHHTFNLRQDSTDNDDDLGVNVGQNYYVSSTSSSSSSGSGNSGVAGITGARRVKNNRSRYNNINNSNNNRAYRRRMPNFNYNDDDDVPPSPYIPNPNADFSPPCPMVPVQEIIPCMSETFEDKFRLSAQAFDDLTKLALGFWRECKDVPIEWANTDTFFKSVPVEFRHYRYEYDHTNEEDDSWKPPTWGDWSSIEQANKSKPANVKKKSIKRQI